MNKTAIKNYAVWARNELKELVTQRAYEYEVTADSVPSYNAVSVHGRLLTDEEKKQLNELITVVKGNGFDHVVEEVAYTWFNRFIVLRYMEVNNYLPQRVRVFSNENNEFKPELLTESIHIELDGLDKQKVFDYIEQNNQEDLYKYLLLTICNDMNQYLPDMFTSISDYKTLLMPNNLLKEDGVLAKLISDIDEDSWNDQVQIIGWLYQYYNSELKDVVMKKKNYTKDDIPAATQLFTPDWIVRYMTENSLGRLWIDGHPNFNHDEWKYYLEEAEQEPEVLEQLNKIKEEHEKLKPEDIKVIDPCMGSGHILVYAFDVLMDIYRNQGYSDRDAARLILENNLYGLEIDERAYHLAYFALMMKARSYNRRILSKDTKVNVFEIRESSGKLKPEYDQYLGNYKDLVQYLINEFQEAKELGSIVNLSCTEEQLDELEKHIKHLKANALDVDLIAQTEIDEIYDLLMPLIRQARLLVQKYDVVITNPPYMAPDAKQKPYVQKNYPDSKSDLFAVFIEKCLSFTNKNGYSCLVTMQSWMFLSSYEKLRVKLLKNNTLTNLMQMENMVMHIAFGTAVSCFCKTKLKDYKGTYNHIKLSDLGDDIPKSFPIKGNRFAQLSTENFSKIPGSPIAYWCRNFDIFKFSNISDYYESGGRNKTHDNDLYVRKWWEINNLNKWQPYDNGGDFRHWYGNNWDLVNWSNEAKNNYASHGGLYNQKYTGKTGICWNLITSYKNGFRIKQSNHHYSSGSPTIISIKEDHDMYVLSFLNCLVSTYILNMFNPTLNTTVGDVLKLPLKIREENKVNCTVKKLISLSKEDWDSFETSWDFTVHPLIKNHVSTVSEAYSLWVKECNDRFNQLKANEEELNRFFIDIYGLQNELDPYVENKDVTVRKANLVRDIKSFISYAVGCMFGRYSLDAEGLTYAGGEWEVSKYQIFIPDKDDIIPICDEEYFEDDIVSRFVEFVSCVYGDDTLEENLKFISDALSGKGNPREVLRNYFLNDFYKDFCKTYQKRPIYWLFDSGKKNGFKALVYIHRYTPDLIARMRTGYIHPLQSQYRTQIEMLNNQIDEAVSTGEKVKLQKQLKKINEQLTELSKYEEIVHHWADKMEPMDLDDGVKANYAKF